jgi:putative glutamine amidotransferase
MKTNGLKPVIGISMCLDKDGLVRSGVDYSYIRREYGQRLKDAGASPIFLDNTIDPEVAAELCDGIVISGGEDIEPRFYKQSAKHVKNTEPSERTEWERKLIDACDQRKVRILGICYGSQLLNIHYGGSLFQDIAAETGSTLDHGKSTKAAMHKVTFKGNFLSFKTNEIVESASRHHQSVNKLGKGIKIAAVAEDGIIEAIAGNGHYGVQWHAEADGTAPKIYGAFVELVKRPIIEDNENYALDPSLEPELV